MKNKSYLIFLIELSILLSSPIYQKYFDSSFEVRKGIMEFNRKNYLESFNLLENIANKKNGDIAAKLVVAQMYTLGLGIEKNTPLAVNIIQCSQEEACHSGATEYYVAEKVCEQIGLSSKDCRKWLTLSANKGYKKAKEKLLPLKEE